MTRAPGASRLGDYLREALRQRRLTIRQAARLADVGVTTLSQAISGGRQPSAGTLRRIARGLGLDVEETLRSAGYGDAQGEDPHPCPSPRGRGEEEPDTFLRHDLSHNWLSIDGAGRRAGARASLFALILGDRASPSPATLQIISDGLLLDYATLLNYAQRLAPAGEDESARAAMVERVVEVSRRLAPQQQEWLLSMLEGLVEREERL